MKTKNIVKLVVNLIVPFVATLLVLLILPKLLVYFAPFVIGWLISLIANPLVKFLEKRLKIVRKTGSAIVIILVLALVILIIYGCVAGIAGQVERITQDIPAMTEGAKTDYYAIQGTLESFFARLPEKTQTKLTDITQNIGDYFLNWISGISYGDFADKASGMVSNIPSVLIGVIVGFMAAYFFIAEKVRIEKLIEDHSNPAMKKQYLALKVQFFDVLGGYFKAQFKIMAVIYVILVIGLGIIGAPYFFLSAFGIAFLDMLPFFGTGTVLIPWAIIKVLTGKYQSAVLLVVLYGVTQLVRQVIQPKLLGDSIGMDPFATLFFMYLGYKLTGVLGMILAVPIAMIIINLYKTGVFDTMIYSAKTLYQEVRDFFHIEVPKE